MVRESRARSRSRARRAKRKAIRARRAERRSRPGTLRGKRQAPRTITIRETATGKVIRVARIGEGIARAKLEARARVVQENIRKQKIAAEQVKIRASEQLKVFATKARAKQIRETKAQITKLKVQQERAVQKVQAAQRKEILAKRKGETVLQREKRLRRELLAQDVTPTGEIKGVFGETRVERIRGGNILRQITTKVRENQTKLIADRINSISNRALTGQTLTPTQSNTLALEINKVSNKLTAAQKRQIKQLPKSVGLGIVDFGRDIKDLVIVLSRLQRATEPISAGKKIKALAKKEGISVPKLIKNNISDLARKTNNIASYVKSNPQEVALIGGALISGGVASLGRSFNKDPVRFGTRAILELFPGIAIKGVKGVAKISKVILKAADRAVFSPNKAVSISKKITELTDKKVKTRFDLIELKILKEQLRVDQELKFVTSAVDDLSKVPSKFIGPIRQAQKGVRTKTNIDIVKGKIPKTGEKKITDLINTQKKLTDKQKAKAFRKSKAKGTRLTPETQARKLAELFKSPTAVNEISTIRITAPEVSRINILDRNVNNLGRDLREINSLLRRGVSDRASTRLNQAKQNILKEITRFEAISRIAKQKITSATNVDDKLKILKSVDRSNQEINKLRSLRSLQFALAKLDRKLGLDKTGLIEQAIKKGKIDTVELEALTSKNFVKGLALRERALKASTTLSEDTIRGLTAQINKLLNRGTFKPTIKQQQRIIKVGKRQVFKEDLRKIPAPLKKDFKKRDLKGKSLNQILADDIKELRRIRVKEILRGERQTALSKSDIDKILISNTVKARAIKKLKQIDRDIEKLQSIIRVLKETTKDVSISKRLRVTSLNEQGQAINLIKVLQTDKVRISKALKEGVKPIDVSQTARRQRVFAEKLKDEIERGKVREVKVRLPKADPNDLTYRINLPGGVQVEFAFNFPKPRAPLKGAKKAQLRSFTKSKKPLFIAKFTRTTKSAIQVPKKLKADIQKGVFNDPSVRALSNRKSLVQQQRKSFQSFRKDVKIKTRNKIDVELKKLNQLENKLDNALGLAIRVATINRLSSFVKSTLKTTLKVTPIIKLDLITQLKLRPIQDLKQLIQEINKDLGFIQVPKPLKKPPGAPPARPPVRPPKKPPGRPPVRPPKRPPTKPPKKPPGGPLRIPILTFDTPLPRGTRLRFDIKFRERRNAAKPFDPKTNPVITKIRKLGLPLNKAIKKGFGGIDMTTQASAQLIISGITKAKDIEKPSSLIKKFRISKGKTALKFVERSRNRIDTQGEKRGLLLSKVLKRKTRKKTTKKRKK